MNRSTAKQIGPDDSARRSGAGGQDNEINRGKLKSTKVFGSFLVDAASSRLLRGGGAQHRGKIGASAMWIRARLPALKIFSSPLGEMSRYGWFKEKISALSTVLRN
jgi:hypothetical protein